MKSRSAESDSAIIVIHVQPEADRTAEELRHKLKISIIVPVLNEAKRIDELLVSLESLDGDKEIIISDGGNNDGTLTLAGNHNVRIITAPKGRAYQMNEGAKASTGYYGSYMLILCHHLQACMI